MEGTDVIVTWQHFRTVPVRGGRTGHCVQGGRAWFARHGLNFGQFVRNGLPASTFEATGDALALALVAHARKEAARGQ